MKPKDPMETLLDDRDALAKAREKKAAAAEEEVDDHAYLGREFLAWLLHRVEQGEATFDGEAGQASFGFGSRAKLTATIGFATDVALKGRSPAGGAEMKAALGSGHAMREAELTVHSGEQEWRFTLVADTLDLRGVKLPKGVDQEDIPKDLDDAELAAIRLQDRLSLLDAALAHVRAAYGVFLEERLSPKWRKHTVPALREWIAAGLAVA
jgi:hypothetical protein